MIQEGIFGLFTTTPAITALLGTSRGDKTTGVFYMLAINEAVFPYIVYNRIGGQPMTFSYQGANKLQDSRFRFSCYALSQQNAVRLAEQIKLLWATYTGTLPDGTVVQNVMCTMENDDSEPQTEGTIYGCHVDFNFAFIDNNGA